MQIIALLTLSRTFLLVVVLVKQRTNVKKKWPSLSKGLNSETN